MDGLEFGTERSVITTYANSEVIKQVKHYKIRVKVHNAQEEMTEYIRFTNELAQARANGTLYYDRDDATKPTFIIDYPNKDGGSYFIIKSYSVVL